MHEVKVVCMNVIYQYPCIIHACIQQLMELDSTTDDQAENLVLSMQKLVDPAEMGRKYKVLALCSPNIEKKLVPGFESFSFSPTQTHEDEAQENSA